MKRTKDQELPIIQKTYDLILWYLPLLNKLPRDYKFTLGERIATGLYDLLDELHKARFEAEKLGRLRGINEILDRLRYLTRLLKDLRLWDVERYARAIKLVNEVGTELGFRKSTETGGLVAFCERSPCLRACLEIRRNPTTGRWWIVKVLPNRKQFAF